MNHKSLTDHFEDFARGLNVSDGAVKQLLRTAYFKGCSDVNGVYTGAMANQPDNFEEMNFGEIFEIFEKVDAEIKAEGKRN